MKQVAWSVTAIAGLLLALTWLTIRATTPDTERHERILGALQTLILNESTLHRDVLRARDGLLSNYDPLVRSLKELRESGSTIQRLNDDADTEHSVRDLPAALDEQASLVETFKSRNALLQNSLRYFGYAIQQLDTDDSDQPAAIKGSVASEMLRFVGSPSQDNAASAGASLDRMAASASPSRQDISAVVAHGRLIVSTLPAVDGIVAGLLASTVGDRARAVQARYLEQHAQVLSEANHFRLVLYATAILLAGSLAFMFVRLGINARNLRARLRFENLIAEISTQFIALHPARMADGIQQGLARLAGHAGVDRAYLLESSADGRTLDRAHVWSADNLPAATNLDRLLDIVACWSLQTHQRQRCIQVSSVQSMPLSVERTALAARGIASWLCVPLWRGERRLGMLGFETTRREGDRTDDDIALFRTAGEIFANAIERDRTESENQALQTQVRRAQRLEAIGTLTGGIAHNFNNILGAVLGYSEMALGKLTADSQPGRYVREARQAGLRAQSVVDQMLTFSRRTDHAHRIVLMRSILDEAVQLLRASLPATVVITVSTSAEADTAAVRGDATQLQQVVMNFCTNAAHAMDDRGTIDVALDTADVGQEAPLSHGTLAEGRYIRLTVRDTGRGIDPETLERIFEPFFTTRRAGTGLGLATVHGIIADHGGALNVSSRPGFGSRFEAYVAAADTDVHEADDTGAPVPTGQGETILLVEDDRPLMLLGEEMVASLGYEPVGFQSGARALANFQMDPDRFDLVLTDEVMPEITGMELALAVHRIRREMPIILVTGQSAPLSRETLQAADICDVLRKPLLLQELGDALARHLPVRARRAVG